MAITRIKMDEKLIKAVNNAIEEAIGEEIDLAIKRLNQRKNEIVAGVLVGVQKMIDIHTSEDRITFTIREITNK